MRVPTLDQTCASVLTTFQDYTVSHGAAVRSQTAAQTIFDVVDTNLRDWAEAGTASSHSSGDDGGAFDSSRLIVVRNVRGGGQAAGAARRGSV